MKFLLKFLSIFAIFGISLMQTFAIDAPINLKTDSINDTTINLSWDAVTDAYMYYVSYGKTSGGEYENQTDFVESGSISISSLELDTTYYFVVTALDENGDESIYSNELSEDITNNVESSEQNNEVFSLKSINVVSSAEIELVFSEPLDSTDGTEREFKIYNKADELDSFELLSIDLNEDDNTKLNLTLDRELEIGVEYEAVVVAIKNSSLENIESGIDSIETFILAETITESNTGETITEELNSASNESSLIGANVENNELENTTLVTADNSSELPKTGPEHILIIILSIILAALLFVFKYKKA